MTTNTQMADSMSQNDGILNVSMLRLTYIYVYIYVSTLIFIVYMLLSLPNNNTVIIVK